MKKQYVMFLMLICGSSVFFLQGPSFGNSAAVYVAGINIRGQESSATESSGTLTGASPSMAAPVLYSRSGNPLPQWYDRQLPHPGRELFQRTRRLLESRGPASETRRIRAAGVGDTQSFWILDDYDSTWRQVPATVLKSGTYCNVYVDDTLTISDAVLKQYAVEFETMVEVMSGNIGTFIDRDGDGKVAILLYDMNDGGSAYSGYLGGYFWSKDYSSDALALTAGLRSNEMDIIYIRGDEPAGWEPAFGDFYDYNLTTLVHEYQHLVHFGVKVWENGGDFSDTWIDEMMAMAAETMYFKEKIRLDPGYSHPAMQAGGYLVGRIEYYNQDLNSSIRNGHGLTYWDNAGDVFANYSLAYLFGQYLAQQAGSGQGVFKEILDSMVASGKNDYRAVLEASGIQTMGIASWADLLKIWAAANMLNQPAGLYGYGGGFSLTPQGPTASSVNLHNSGVIYRVDDGTWAEPADKGPGVRYYAFDADGLLGGDNTTTTTTTVPGDTTTTTSAAGSGCPEGLPVLCYDETQEETWCCSLDYPVCGSGDDWGFCYSDSGRACAAAHVLGNESAAADSLRAFRDEVLTATQAGAALAALYYRHTAEIEGILSGNPPARRQVRKALTLLVPVLSSPNAGALARVDGPTAEALNRACRVLADEAGPELSAAILNIQQQFNSGELFKTLGIGGPARLN